ncbi:cysteine-rich venom protein 6-like [Leptopilina heterotoma]|uniref:cysteine-rich venom protein 6-like n=1 Tax=Leptopilina heterotoma TaxID=63436 RepID=UPI001CA90983|nr:cysteine-rich venom protein 6-like [Leptopilina heterotoma]
MSHSFVILFVVLVASAITINAQHCGQNKHYVSCGSGCEIRTCEDLNTPPPRFCPFICNSGCICNEGYIQLSKSDDRCVRINDCPPIIQCRL